MAIFTSIEKCFEVTAISFSPASIAFGEETSYSITIKNNSGKKISSMYAGFLPYFRDASGTVRSGAYEYMYGGPAYAMKAISWSSGASKTFTGKFSVRGSYDVSTDERLIPIFTGGDAGYTDNPDEPLGLMLDFTTNVEIASGGSNSDQFFNLRGNSSEYLKIYDARYVPSILKFGAERSMGATPDDEGENILTAIRLRLGDGSHADRLRLSLLYRDRAVGGDYASIDLSRLTPDALAGEIAAVITDSFNKNSDWELRLAYGDEFETAEAALELSRAFANVHLSGASTGGVCFGSFSKATEGNPLFQCYYPSVFYAGIEGVTNYALGEVATGGTWIDGKKIYRQVFCYDGGETANTTLAIGTIENYSDIDTMIDICGSSKVGDQFFPITRIWSTTTWISMATNGDGVIQIKVGAPSVIAKCVVVIYYTKIAG